MTSIGVSSDRNRRLPKAAGWPQPVHSSLAASAQPATTQRPPAMERPSGALAYAKLTVAGFAFCGLFLAAFGLSTAHAECKHNCQSFSFHWWVVGMEILTLAFHAATNALQTGSKFHLPSIGLLILACTALDECVRNFVSSDHAAVGKHTAQSGFSLLMTVNVAVALISSLEHFQQPGSFVQEPEEDRKNDLEEGQSSPEEVPEEITSKWRSLLSAKSGKLGLVCAGLAGTVVSVVGYDKSCIVGYCTGKEFFWWVAAAEIVLLLGFVYTEILEQMPQYRPVTALLTALHVPYLTGVIDGMLRTNEAQWDWTYRKLVFAGCVVIALVNFGILPLLQNASPAVEDPVAQSKVRCHFALPPVLGAISGFMFAYIKEKDPSEWSGFTWWGFSQEIVVLMGVLVTLCPQVSVVTSLRLPLVTLIAIATFDPMVRVHNWVREDNMGCSDLCIMDDINGVGYLILVVSHILLILAMGWDCPGTSDSCPGNNFIAKLFEKKDKESKVIETVPMSGTTEGDGNNMDNNTKHDHAINIE